MAYMNQESKALLAPAIKEVLAKHGIKGTLAVRGSTHLVLNIKSGRIDFDKNQAPARPDQPRTTCHDGRNVNQYWYQEHFTGAALDFFTELFPALNCGNHDKSDIMTDYFNVGWYVDVNIGRWDRAYVVT